MTIKKAEIKNVEEIRLLIEKWAMKGLMLQRSLIELYENIRDFWVYKSDDKTIGCAALHIDWADLGEIKSLAVEEKNQGQGIGNGLVDACLSEAREMGLKKIFVLTYQQKFFEKKGFRVIDKSLLPHQIWSECLKCPKFPDCDEIAMMHELK